MTIARCIAAAVLLALAVLSMLLLLMGAAVVGVRLPGGLPMGNLLAALVFVATAIAACVLSPAGTRVVRVSRWVAAGAVAWLPLSIGLAGNLDLNFSGDRGSTWLVSSLGLLLAILATLAWATLAAWRHAIRTRRR